MNGRGDQHHLKLENKGGWAFTQGVTGEWLGKPIVEVEAAKVTGRPTTQGY